MMNDSATQQQYTEDDLHGIISAPAYGLVASEKQSFFLTNIKKLYHQHWLACEPYRRVMLSEGLRSSSAIEAIDSIDALPFLAVSLFKQFRLQSVPDEAVRKTLYSSGTTSQIKSQVVLDKTTAELQSRVLIKIMQSFIGKQRLPMLIADMSLKEGNSTSEGYTARGAGIQGLALLGRLHTYLLDKNLNLAMDALEQYCEKHGKGPVLLFGFTWLVWSKIVHELASRNKRINFPEGILLHSGGWKKLHDQAVSNSEFKEAVEHQLGIRKVHNFYGMAEQVGSVFVECERGVLHVPVMAELIIRHPITLESQPMGEKGVIQVLSLLPVSYPGHSLLTEDFGVIHGEDDCACGRKGKYFSVLGRLPKVEQRGCSDTL